MPNRSNSRSHNPGAVPASGLPPPPSYAQAAPGGRSRRDRNDDSTGRGTELPNHRRRGSSRERRGSASGGGSYRGGIGTAAVTNQHGERVDTSRGGQGGVGSNRRGGQRVGMECLSPINVARDGPASSQGVRVCVGVFVCVLRQPNNREKYGTIRYTPVLPTADCWLLYGRRLQITDYRRYGVTLQQAVECRMHRSSTWFWRCGFTGLPTNNRAGRLLCV